MFCRLLYYPLCVLYQVLHASVCGLDRCATRRRTEDEVMRDYVRSGDACTGDCVRLGGATARFRSGEGVRKKRVPTETSFLLGLRQG